jgi:hypothetical protein
MSNPDGSIKFNGPFSKIAEWVKLSKEIGIDYHSMEIKWHDGICYFNTKLTNWKTKTDYAAQFAELSRRAKIPFMFYYSSLIDHNPQFDSIQPKPHATESIIALGRQPVYEDYLRGHYREIMEQYGPDGIWLDWYWPIIRQKRASNSSENIIRTPCLPSTSPITCPAPTKGLTSPRARRTIWTVPISSFFAPGTQRFPSGAAPGNGRRSTAACRAIPRRSSRPRGAGGPIPPCGTIPSSSFA